MRFEVAGFGVDVICIEPGLIVTEFGDAAVGALAEGAAAEGPYAEFNAHVGRLTAGAYRGPMRRLGGGPRPSRRTIEKAITARRPRARYRVTPSARLAIAQRRMVSDRLWDRAMGSQFPRPKP